MSFRPEVTMPLRNRVRSRARRMFGASMVLAFAVLVSVACDAAGSSRASALEPTSEPGQAAAHHPADHPYLGMWVTADGRIRQELLPSGRYDEARGERESAYTGRYEVRGTHIEYWDDTGFTADGTFVTDHELHHGGMIFFRQQP